MFGPLILVAAFGTICPSLLCGWVKETLWSGLDHTGRLRWLVACALALIFSSAAIGDMAIVTGHPGLLLLVAAPWVMVGEVTLPKLW